MGFDPMSLGMAGLGAGMSLFKGFSGAAGARSAGAAASSADQFQAFVALKNAEIADQDAAWAMQSGEQNAYNTGMQGRQAVGKLKAAQGASGVDVNSKSFTDSRIGVENASLQDATNVRTHAAQQSYGDSMRAWASRTQAMMDMMGASEAGAAASKKADASLIEGGAEAFTGINKAFPNLGSSLGSTISGMFGGGGGGGSGTVNLVPGAEINGYGWY